MEKFKIQIHLGLRNILRYKMQHLVIGVLISFSSIMIVSFFAFQQESYKNISNSIIDVLMGHLVVISEDNKAVSYMPEDSDWQMMKPIDENGGSIRQVLEEQKDVKAYSDRLRFTGLLENGKKQVQSLVIGVNPDLEGKVSSRVKTSTNDKLKPTGDEVYLTKSLKNKLKVSVGDKVNFYAEKSDGTTGIKELVVKDIVLLQGMDKYEMDYAYININTAKELTGTETSTNTEYVIRLKNESNLNDVKQDLQKKFKTNNIKANVYTWKELGGTPVAIIRVVKAVFIITLVVSLIIILLIFTIATTIMVINRTSEIGCMRAIGIQKRDIMIMFLVENELICIIFSAIGVIIGGILTVYVSKNGGAPVVSDMMEFIFGGSNLYPKLHWYNPVGTFLLFDIVGILASIYPAWKAGKMKPIDAIENRI